MTKPLFKRSLSLSAAEAELDTLVFDDNDLECLMPTGNSDNSTEERATLLPPITSPSNASTSLSTSASVGNEHDAPKALSLTFLNSKFSLGHTHGTMQMKKIKLVLEGVPETSSPPVIRIKVDCEGDKNVLNAGSRASVEVKLNKADKQWSPADSPEGYIMKRRDDSSYVFEPYCQFTHQTIISEWYKSRPSSGPLILSFYVDGITGFSNSAEPYLVTQPVSVIRQRPPMLMPALSSPNLSTSLGESGDLSMDTGEVTTYQEARSGRSRAPMKKRWVAAGSDGQLRLAVLPLNPERPHPEPLMNPEPLSPSQADSPLSPLSFAELEVVRGFKPFPSEKELRILWQPLKEWTVVHYDLLFKSLQGGFLRAAEAGRLGQYKGASSTELCVAKFMAFKGKRPEHYQHCSDKLRECERACAGSIDKSYTHCAAAFKTELGAKSEMLALIDIFSGVGVVGVAREVVGIKAREVSVSKPGTLNLLPLSVATDDEEENVSTTSSIASNVTARTVRESMDEHRLAQAVATMDKATMDMVQVGVKDLTAV